MNEYLKGIINDDGVSFDDLKASYSPELRAILNAATKEPTLKLSTSRDKRDIEDVIRNIEKAAYNPATAHRMFSEACFHEGQLLEANLDTIPDGGFRLTYEDPAADELSYVAIIINDSQKHCRPENKIEELKNRIEFIEEGQMHTKLPLPPTLTNKILKNYQDMEISHSSIDLDEIEAETNAMVNDTPTSIEYFTGGNVAFVKWEKEGELHREAGPALIRYNRTGDIVLEEWHLCGKLHREDGPAEIMYNADGEVFERNYYEHGEEVDPPSHSSSSFSF